MAFDMVITWWVGGWCHVHMGCTCLLFVIISVLRYSICIHKHLTLHLGTSHLLDNEKR